MDLRRLVRNQIRLEFVLPGSKSVEFLLAVQQVRAPLGAAEGAPRAHIRIGQAAYGFPRMDRTGQTGDSEVRNSPK